MTPSLGCWYDLVMVYDVGRSILSITSITHLHSEYLAPFMAALSLHTLLDFRPSVKAKLAPNQPSTSHAVSKLKPKPT